MDKFIRYTLDSIDTGMSLTTPLELKDYIPFEVKRIYFMTSPKEGFSKEHAHYVEEEFFIVIQGKATAIIDYGSGKQEILMKNGRDAIYVANKVWHGFRDMSDDVIILALSSTNYKPDRSDYIEDYEKYLTIRDE